MWPANSIASPVVNISVTRHCYERICRLLGIFPVTQRHLGTTHQEFALLSRRNLTQSFVHNQILHAWVGIANRHDSHLRFSRGMLGIPAIKSAGNRKLRRPIQVLDNRVGRSVTPCLNRSHWQGFTAKQADPKLRIMARLQEAKLLHKNRGGRNRKPHGQIIVFYEAVRLDEFLLRWTANASAALPRNKHVKRRQIESHVEHLRQSVLFGHFIAFNHVVEERDDVPLSDSNTLRCAGTSRRKEQVSQ